MGDGGKGSQQRPTNKKKFDENYDRIFGNKKKEEKKWNLMIIILIDMELKNGKNS